MADLNMRAFGKTDSVASFDTALDYGRLIQQLQTYDHWLESKGLNREAQISAKQLQSIQLSLDSPEGSLKKRRQVNFAA
jgi:hypothetical protein